MSDSILNGASTLWMVMAQFNGRTVIPVADVCRAFFLHLSEEKFLRKCLRGDLALPVVRIEKSQKSMRGIYVSDLAAYIDERRAAAVRERDQLCGLDP
ncbi:MAG: pyocin activator PrtN family protein [Pseudolabrys sp.]|nr:pyocin activator PrtN family protein [Pseudolabrys sp.]